MEYMNWSHINKTRRIFVISFIVCLCGCTSVSNSDNKISNQPSDSTNSTTTEIALEETTIDVNELEELEINEFDQYFGKENTYYYRMKEDINHTISFDEYNIKNISEIGVDSNLGSDEIVISTVIMKPLKMSADYVMSEGFETSTFTTGEASEVPFISSGKLSDTGMDYLEEKELLFTSLTIPNIRVDFPIQEQTLLGTKMSVYFYPICYKVTSQGQTVYIPKSIETVTENSTHQNIDGLLELSFSSNHS